MKNQNQKTEDLGNNETRSIGVFNQGDQGWLAMSRTASKWFKTERGANNWLKRNFPDVAKEVGLIETPNYSAFQKWFLNFIEEKQVDLSEFCKAGDGSSLQLGDVASNIMSAPANEQEKIKTTLVMIDFKNGSVEHFLKHLAQALTQNDKVSL